MSSATTEQKGKPDFDVETFLKSLSDEEWIKLMAGLKIIIERESQAGINICKQEVPQG